MTAESILSTVATAAKERHTLLLRLHSALGRIDAEVEPYSVIHRSRRPMIYCWDVGENRVVALPVDSLVHAEATDRSFNPRYEVEF